MADDDRELRREPQTPQWVMTIWTSSTLKVRMSGFGGYAPNHHFRLSFGVAKDNSVDWGFSTFSSFLSAHVRVNAVWSLC